MSYKDNDGDGYGNNLEMQMACEQQINYVEIGDDCNDNDQNVNPSATEKCNNIDENCDGEIYDVFTELGNECTVGLGECQITGNIVCREDGTDTECDVNPKDPEDEICDGLDNDCDGETDNGCDGICKLVNYQSDEDCDGYHGDVICDSYTYNINGNVLSYQSDTDCDGIINSSEHHTYDSNGNMLTDQNDYNCDGTQDICYSYTYAWCE